MSNTAIVKALSPFDIDHKAGKEIVSSKVSLGRSRIRDRILNVVGSVFYGATTAWFATIALVATIPVFAPNVLTLIPAAALGAYTFGVVRRSVNTRNLPAIMQSRALDSGLNYKQSQEVNAKTVEALRIYRWLPMGEVSLKHKSKDMSDKNATHFHLVMNAHEAEINVSKNVLHDFDNAFISALEMSGESFEYLSALALTVHSEEKWAKIREKEEIYITNNPDDDFDYDPFVRGYESNYRRELESSINKDCSINY